MSNDLSLPRPGRLQAGKRPRQRRKRRPHHGDPAPMTIRIVRSYALPYSQRETRKLQQFIDGEWHDVLVLNESNYPLPCGRTK